MMANRVFVRYFSSRYNPLGVQMLSKSLYEQVFGMEAKQTFSKEQIQCGIDHLTRHGLWGRHVDPLPDVDIKLPPLTAKNINDHFVNLANQQLGPYLPLINSLTSGDLPPRPSKWNYQAGWTKYDHLTNTWEWVRCPDNGALVLDVEVCVREGHAPTLAVAVSPDNWYSWVSKRLMEDQDYLKRSKVTLDDLIPMEDGDLSRERIIVGHNVSYDRARIKEQYFIKNTRTKFLDTLSLHVCVAGQTSIQKSLSSANKREKISTDENNDKIANEPKWSLVGSSNSLAEVYKLHCGGDEIDKSIRDVFVSGTITQIRDKFQELMGYCSTDVLCTHRVLQAVYPLFQYHCPHPVTLAGMLEMNSMFLPVNSSWKKFVQSSKFAAEDLEWEMSTKLMSLADSACAHAIDESYKKDVWLYNLDWSSKKLRSKKRSPREMKRLMERLRDMDGKDGHEEDGQYQLVVSIPDQSKRRVHKPGYPEWYRQLCINITQSPWQPGPALISPNMRVVSYLLRMKWNNHPLYYHPALAWGYIVPSHLRPSQIPQWGHNDIIIK
jgi:DNA polymerase gamma 1